MARSHTGRSRCSLPVVRKRRLLDRITGNLDARPASRAASSAPARSAVQARAALVPAYFRPQPGASDDPWVALSATLPPRSIVVVNPANGPGGMADARLYDGSVAAVRAAGHAVLGYVHTTWWRRAEAAVLADVAGYARDWELDGVFLDELSNEPAPDRLRAVRAAQRGDLLVGNPGAPAPAAWQLESLDVIVTYEGTAADYLGFSGPAWTREHAHRCAHLVYGATEPSLVAAVRARCDARLLYVTDGTEPNPWAAPFTG